jgi:uncharacterized protein YkwD
MAKFLLFFIVTLLAQTALAADLEAFVFCSINEVRASHGLSALSPDPRLKDAARSQSLWMASEGRMDHMRYPARSLEEFLVCEYHPSNRVVKSGYFKFQDLFRIEMTTNGAVVVPLPAANDQVGEIIAKGLGGVGAYDYRVVVRGWMNSPPHRKEILKAPYRDMGVSVVSPRHGETYWCVVFGYQLSSR